jgi:hypothetical protein
LPSRTPQEAFDNYVERLRDVLHCVTQSRLGIHASAQIRSNTPYALALNKMEQVQLDGPLRLRLVVAQTVETVDAEQDTDSKSFEIRMSSYFYQLTYNDGRELLSYHWTPDAVGPGTVTFPHLHLGAAMTVGAQVSAKPDLNKIHLPTGHVSLARIVRLAITEFGVKPIRSNWHPILERAERTA